MSDNLRLPQLTARRVIGVLQRAGFSHVRTAGGHYHFKKPDHHYLVTVPSHGSAPIKPGTLRAIIRGSGLSKSEFIALLDQ